MTDKPADESPRTGRAASSPYDEPTEQIPSMQQSNAYRRTSVPRTDDDLDGPMPTQAYTPAQDDDQRTYAFSSPAQPVDTSTGNGRTVDQYSDDRPSRGTIDLGLLILRVAIGAVFFVHGLQKLTGWWGGPGLDGIESMMDRGGWSQPLATGILLMVGELAGGALLILGLASPLAAGALLAVAIDAWLFRQGASAGLQHFAPDGPEFEAVLVAATAALVLTGPGRISLDGGRGWATKPAFGSFLVLLLAIAAAMCTWIFLHGGNLLV